LTEAVKPSVGSYVLGVFVTLGCLILGNLLGYVLTSIWGWANLDYDRPGGVALSAVQAVVGAMLAYAASAKLFHSPDVADLWMKFTVWLLSGLYVAFIIIFFLTRQYELVFKWNTAATAAYLIALEVTRRAAKDEFG
jgi:hypothetical protein